MFPCVFQCFLSPKEILKFGAGITFRVPKGGPKGPREAQRGQGKPKGALPAQGYGLYCNVDIFFNHSSEVQQTFRLIRRSRIDIGSRPRRGGGGGAGTTTKTNKYNHTRHRNNTNMNNTNINHQHEEVEGGQESHRGFCCTPSRRRRRPARPRPPWHIIL